MAFHEVLFPVDISFGSRGGPGHRTAITISDSGAETRVARWSSPRRRYDPSEAVKTQDQLSVLLDFCIARGGAMHGFRYKDWSDYTTAVNHRDAPSTSDHVIGTGDNSNLQFQLKKLYPNAAGADLSRNIIKPVAGTVVLAVGGTAQVEGVNFSVDTTSGIVTLVVAPGAGVDVTAGCEFEVPVRFDGEVDDLFDVTLESFNTGSIASVRIVEIIDGLQVSEDFDYGGAETVSSGINFVAAIGLGRVKNVTMTTTGLGVIMPDSTNLPLGGPYFYIANSGASNTFNIIDEDTITVLYSALAVSGGNLAMVLEDDGVGGKQWAPRLIA